MDRVKDEERDRLPPKKSKFPLWAIMLIVVGILIIIGCVSFGLYQFVKKQNQTLITYEKFIDPETDDVRYRGKLPNGKFVKLPRKTRSEDLCMGQGIENHFPKSCAAKLPKGYKNVKFDDSLWIATDSDNGNQLMQSRYGFVWDTHDPDIPI